MVLAPGHLVRASLPGGAHGAFTTRAGGISAGDKGPLNLARHVDDEPGAVTANRDALARLLERPVAYVDQVHGTGVRVLDDPADAAAPVEADAQVTRRRDVALAVLVADCLPVLLADVGGGVVGCAHAGRRGLLDGVLERTVEAMTALGADPARTTAVIGPSICGSCYEVPADMAAHADADRPGIRSATRWGSSGLDLRAGARAALRDAGLAADRILADAPCTLEDERFHSHRRTAHAGRIAGIVHLA